MHAPDTRWVVALVVARAVPLHRTNSWPFPIATHVPTRKISGHLWGWTLHLLRRPTNRGFRRATRNVNCHFLSCRVITPFVRFPLPVSFSSFLSFFGSTRWSIQIWPRVIERSKFVPRKGERIPVVWKNERKVWSLFKKTRGEYYSSRDGGSNFRREAKRVIFGRFGGTITTEKSGETLTKCGAMSEDTPSLHAHPIPSARYTGSSPLSGRIRSFPRKFPAICETFRRASPRRAKVVQTAP